jgi:hypothetical protein
LELPASSEETDDNNCLSNLKDAASVLESLANVKKVVQLPKKKGRKASKFLWSKTEFGHLFGNCPLVMARWMVDRCTSPFLLHQFRRRDIVTDILAEDWNREVPVNVGGADFGHVAIENEFVALRPKANCMLSPNQGECEAVTVLYRLV